MWSGESRGPRKATTRQPGENAQQRGKIPTTAPPTPRKIPIRKAGAPPPAANGPSCSEAPPGGRARGRETRTTPEPSLQQKALTPRINPLASPLQWAAWRESVWRAQPAAHNKVQEYRDTKAGIEEPRHVPQDRQEARTTGAERRQGTAEAAPPKEHKRIVAAPERTPERRQESKNEARPGAKARTR